jgi:predicted RNA-binding protein YlxR (DUF448 family)
MSGSIGARASRKGPRPKHVPLRTCVVCRDKDAKRQFVRIVRTPDEGVQIDPTGKRNGRGAYLCDKYTCWERAVVGTALDRALKADIDADVRNVLSQYADEHFRKDDNVRS